MFYKLVTGAFGQRALFYVKTKTQSPFWEMGAFRKLCSVPYCLLGGLGKKTLKHKPKLKAVARDELLTLRV